jgi:hypothetical protein
MPSSLPRMIRAAADRVPLFRARSRIAGTPFRPARTGIRTGPAIPWSADRDPWHRRVALACREAAR